MELELGKDLGLRYSPLEYELSFWVKTPESLKLGTCSLTGHFGPNKSGYFLFLVVNRWKLYFRFRIL